MKKIIALIMAQLILSPVFALADSLDDQLAKDADIAKQNISQFNNEQIQLIDVGYDKEQRKVWHKAIIHIKVTPEQLTANDNIAALCSTPLTRKTIDQGISYQYSYFDATQAPIKSFVIDKSSCQSFDKLNLAQ